MTMYAINIPTPVVMGAGSLEHLAQAQLPGSHALIVTSNGTSMRANGYLERVEAHLAARGVKSSLYACIGANPTTAQVDAGGAAANAAEADFLIALGGGSVIDATKGIAIVATNAGKYWDFVQSGTGGRKPVKNKPLPIVAIVTTAGTGSETDSCGVVTNPDTHEKIGFGTRDTFPVLSISDPELMCTVPAHLTAYQGFDALFHCMEAYLNVNVSLPGDMYALEGIRRLAKALPRVVADGSDVDGRELMAWGAYLGGVVIEVSGLTSQHSIEHALSAYHPTLPHGAGLIMLSRAWFGRLVKAHDEKLDVRLANVAQALSGKTSLASDLVPALQCVLERTGCDELKMSHYGIKPDEFKTFAKNARAAMGGLFDFDPVQLSDADVVKILEESYA